MAVWAWLAHESLWTLCSQSGQSTLRPWLALEQKWRLCAKPPCPEGLRSRILSDTAWLLRTQLVVCVFLPKSRRDFGRRARWIKTDLIAPEGNIAAAIAENLYMAPIHF